MRLYSITLSNQGNLCNLRPTRYDQFKRPLLIVIQDMLIPTLTKLNNQQLMKAASHLNTFGKLAISANKLIYLDVDDAYINKLYPLLNDPQIKKPDYFKQDSVGAHVSVVYRDEDAFFDNKDLGKEYHFKIKELVIAEINLKNYYVLLLDSPMLRQLRVKYGLQEQLNFKNYLIDFHITIGVA